MRANRSRWLPAICLIALALTESAGAQQAQTPYAGHGAESVPREKVAKYAPTPLPGGVTRRIQMMLDVRGAVLGHALARRQAPLLHVEHHWHAERLAPRRAEELSRAAHRRRRPDAPLRQSRRTASTWCCRATSAARKIPASTCSSPMVGR